MDVHSLECLDFHRIREILAGFALCGLGRSLAANIRPAIRVTLVKRWLAQVTELQRLAEQRGMPPFGGITDVREVLQRCAPPLRVTVEEVARIGTTLTGTHSVSEYLRDLPEDYPELRHLAGRVGDFRTIADRIGTVIDERGRVRNDASPKLQRIRAEIEEASRQIDQTVARLLREPNVRRLLQYPNHTFHGDRLVVPLRTEYRGRLPGIVHRTSDSGATLYVEPSEVVELNNRISNLRSEEQEEIGRLLWDLAHEIHLNGREIHKTLETLAVIDLIAAKVRFAEEFAARCPQINDEGTLSVREARHPLLLEMARQKRAAGETPAEIVPIDYRLGVDFNLLIITGPNTGGKTVTLKTVGLLCLMVQAGLPIPVAAGSELGVFGNVLIDVGDEQSMQQSLSTFSGHLTRLLDMLRHAGPRALLLIDELGAGTDPDEGAALGRAILDELLRLRCRCIATTHLGALKGYALTRARAENACVEFDAKTLQPTFHLSLGEPGSSNAIEIAGRLGMPRRLVSVAYRSLSRKARALHAALEGTRVVKRQAEHARKEAETARLEADRKQGEAVAARATLEQQQSDFQQWVQRVVHLQTGDAVRVRNFDRDGKIVRMRLDQQRAEVDVGTFSVEVPLGDVLPPRTPAPPPRPRPKPTPPPPRREKTQRARQPRPVVSQDGKRADSARAEQSRQREQKRRPPMPSLTEEQATALQPMDPVYVQRFHREGRVVRLKLSKKLAIVNMGLLEVEVPFDGLAFPPQPKRPQKPRPRPTPKSAKSKAMPPEVSSAPSQPAAPAQGESSPADSDSPTPTQPAEGVEAPTPEPGPQPEPESQA
ncbi:MAG: DNA strand exchange inhibitor protein [Phycisphaerae bacterium]|nr:DNA strand exchange inhibitor protein [Phycisphaerae bacterium]